MAKVTRHRATPKKKASRKKASRRVKSTPSLNGEGFLGKSALGMILYGPPGVGKSSWAAQMPKPGFIIDREEEGIHRLVEYGQAPAPEFIETVRSWTDVERTLDNVLSRTLDCSTLVLDSLTGFESLCFHHTCENEYDGDWSKKGFYNYFQGPTTAATVYWPVLMDKIVDIRQSGINVIFIGHSQVKTFANPEGSDYDRYTPFLTKQIWQITHKWAQLVLFYNYYVDVDKSGQKAKAKPDSTRRYLYTEHTGTWEAKNQFGLPPLIDAGSNAVEAFHNFVDTMTNL